MRQFRKKKLSLPTYMPILRLNRETSIMMNVWKKS